MYKKKTISTVYKTIALAAPITLLLISTYFAGRELVPKYKHFYTTDVIGQIAELSTNKNCTVIKLRNDNTDYPFCPNDIVVDGEDFDFRQKVSILDSFFKPRFSDSIKIKKT